MECRLLEMVYVVSVGMGGCGGGWGGGFFFFFFFNDTATTEIYTLSLHDALPILPHGGVYVPPVDPSAPPMHTREDALSNAVWPLAICACCCNQLLGLIPIILAGGLILVNCACSVCL